MTVARGGMTYLARGSISDSVHLLVGINCADPQLGGHGVGVYVVLACSCTRCMIRRTARRKRGEIDAQFAAAEVGETVALDGPASAGLVGGSLGYRVVVPVGRYWPGG